MNKETIQLRQERRRRNHLSHPEQSSRSESAFWNNQNRSAELFSSKSLSVVRQTGAFWKVGSTDWTTFDGYRWRCCFGCGRK